MSREDVADWIRRQLEEGIEVTADDFEGWECATCGELIPFHEVLDDRDAVETWDVTVQDPDEDEPEGHYLRFYFCSEECRHEARCDPRTTIDEANPDHVKERGAPVIAEGDLLREETES